MSAIPKSAITERQLKKMMKKAAKGHTSLSAWAVENGITSQQVTAFVRGEQGAGLKLPTLLGYRPQTIFIPMDEEPICNLPTPRRQTSRPTIKVDHGRDPIEKKGLKLKDPKKEARKRLKERNR